MESNKQQSRRAIVALVMVWALICLACSMPLNQPTGEGLALPTRSVQPEDSAEITLAPTLSRIEPEQSVANDAVTPTPQQETQTGSDPLVFAPTATPYSGQVATPSELTPVAGESGEALRFSYTLSWRFDQDRAFSFADVVLDVTGGEEPYTYFRDNVSYPNPQFSYRWGSCRQNPGTFRVVDATGNSAEIAYREQSPCP